jgi:small subunit ribosomal protein S6
LPDYELATIVDPDLDEDQVQSTISMVAQIIGEQGGVMISTDRWEKRRLAYPIKKKREGSHVFFRFSADPAGLPEIKRRLGIAESVIRHMVVLLEPWDDVPAAVRGVPRAAAVQEVQAAPAQEPETEAEPEPEPEAEPAPVVEPDAEPAPEEPVPEADEQPEEPESSESQAEQPADETPAEQGTEPESPGDAPEDPTQ